MSPLKIPLQVSCPNCQQGNLPGSPYCNGCGAPLGEAAPIQPEAILNGAAIDDDPIKRFLNEGQDRLLVKQSYDRASSILTTGESIAYVGTASKSNLTHSPDCLVVTNKRIMLLRKKVLGKYELDDCYWRDVRDISTKDGKSGVVVTVEAIQGWRITADAFPRAQARRLLEVAAEHSERIRELLAQRDGFEALATPGTAVVAAVPDGAVVAAPRDAQPATRPAPATVPTTASWASTSAAPSPWAGRAPASPSPNVAAEPVPAPGAVPAADSTGMGRADVQLAPQSGAANAPANFTPTPESVLQSILHQTQMTQDGPPTRPMQLSAAAFQAPALADAQSVTFRDTDTEPNMRPAPPMPTLEQIAVFSGPLAFSHMQSGELSTPLAGKAGTADEPDWTPQEERSTLSNGSYALDESEVADGNMLASTATGQNAAGDSSQKRGSALESKKSTLSDTAKKYGPGQTNGEATQDTTAAPPNSVDVSFEVADLMGFMMSDESILDGEALPLPGTLSSGPLLEASPLDSLDTRRLASQAGGDTEGLRSDTLYFDSSMSDLDLDRPTDINLGQYSVPARNGRSSSGGGSQKSQSGRNSGASSGGRASQSKKADDDPIAKMKQLKMLLDAGFITESDYEAKKADILARYF